MYQSYVPKSMGDHSTQQQLPAFSAHLFCKTTVLEPLIQARPLLSIASIGRRPVTSAIYMKEALAAGVFGAPSYVLPLPHRRGRLVSGLW